MVANKGAIIRLVIMILALANQILMMSGKPVIDINNEDVEIFISSIFTIGTALISWYYNNPTSKVNEIATEQMRSEKFKEFLDS